MNKCFLFWPLVFLVVISGCSTEKDYLVTFHTPYGDMQAVLYDATPKHKKNFIALAESGKYDSTIFHRVIQDFMVQGGDLTTSTQYNPEDSIDYTISAEFVDTLFHKKGALAAARQGDQRNPERASSGSQFYIVQGTVYSEDELITDMNELARGIRRLFENREYADVEKELMSLHEKGDYQAYTKKLVELKPLVKEKLNIEAEKDYPKSRLQAYTSIGGTPHLDNTYTVFGEIIEGLSIIDSIAAQPTDAMDKPVQNIYMTVEVEEVSKKKITKEYGYQFPSAN
ncbi:peptidylprolyl isomerase [Catalinimonas niigatensis]|uniref:peptidylprolyl isomerase n=1 Tax=Catalinimonas niigatensis TaxID=1397264 RepID=UPI00266674EF|nr:peptidylprolyl isomerase [Catalinimonas niigatensis]WPP52267.1 peptidylprolyl isomerase [Catalinimonas niigatensis]